MHRDDHLLILVVLILINGNNDYLRFENIPKIFELFIITYSKLSSLMWIKLF